MFILSNYIGGKLQPPVSGNYLDNYNPATGSVYAQIPDSDENDVELAVTAAKNAFADWSTTDAVTRSRILYRIAELIGERFDALAEAESMDSGKPLALAKRMDITRARDNFEFFAASVLHFSSESHNQKGKFINYTTRYPIGVVGCISPWNLPLYLFTWKIAPALAAGNCVVAKPSEITPVTAFMLSEICIEAGLPTGVLNIVHGTGPKTGAAIVKHPLIKGISFTGSTRAGREIASVTAPMFKKVSLELGGKNPVIIFADCDYEEMLNTTVRSSFTNQGQICLCGSRIYIESSIYERFKADFVERAKKLIVGDPKAAETNVGAVVSEVHYNKILSYIDLAKEEGGKVLCGGEAVKFSGDMEKGWFVAPTVIEGLNQQCRTVQEEIFGPVVTLHAFNNDEEAVNLANQSDYGLAAVIWTNHLTRAHRLSEQLESGIVWVNCWLERDLRTPFGGVKQSGVGREGGVEALRFFTEPKNICIKI
ncbi:MAG: aldehyde dehydrogenase [Chitinophagales bacterium]|nr:aldehyde dehydrogenase [Bacteroidota bacterium]